MSRKVTLSVPVDIVVRDRDVRLLAAVSDAAPRAGRPLQISLAQLSDALGTSVFTCRRAVISCRDEGYLEVQEHHMPNGAQRENSYRLTPAGEAVLHSARQANLVA